jgi:hypothetical protein
MKELIRIMWVLLIQYIACWLAGWETSVILLTLALLIIWQGIFAWINNRVRKQKCSHSKNDVSPVMYMVLSVPALCFPVLALLIFFGLSVYRVCVIGAVTVGEQPFRSNFTLDSDHVVKLTELDHDMFPSINHDTGLPMCGKLEPAGNLYGVWGSSGSHNT